jgi:hypothetical protein
MYNLCDDLNLLRGLCVGSGDLLLKRLDSRLALFNSLFGKYTLCMLYGPVVKPENAYSNEDYVEQMRFYFRLETTDH